MDSAQTIRNAVDRVAALRVDGRSQPGLHEAILAVKRFQAWRFAQTYGDELQSGPYRGAARFFLDELYSDRDYSARDAQFSRIASALQTLFPKQVVATAVLLAELHALTEELDSMMGKVWLAKEGVEFPSESARYAQVWREVGRRSDRENQLQSVLHVGQELDQLTRTPGLRMMLKLMRRPAQAARLSALQQFLEYGFDTFAAMSRDGKGATAFLSMVEARESRLIETLFSRDFQAFGTRISNVY